METQIKKQDMDEIFDFLGVEGSSKTKSKDISSLITEFQTTTSIPRVRSTYTELNKFQRQLAAAIKEMKNSGKNAEEVLSSDEGKSFLEISTLFNTQANKVSAVKKLIASYGGKEETRESRREEAKSALLEMMK